METDFKTIFHEFVEGAAKVLFVCWVALKQVKLFHQEGQKDISLLLPLD